MGQLSRHEARLFDRATAAAIKDREALGSARLAATGKDVHQQLADVAAGERRSHHERGEEHPRQASAVATHRGETAGVAVLPFFPSPTVMAPAPVSAESLRQLGPRPPPAAQRVPLTRTAPGTATKKRGPPGAPLGG